MSASDYTPEVFTLTDRVAAAFLRGDIEYARELINGARLTWEATGRESVARELRQARDFDVTFHHEADVYFQTKDGLRVLGKIEPKRHWPVVWKRACHGKHDFARLDSPPNFEPREVRTYEYSGERADDGRPIYREV